MSEEQPKYNEDEVHLYSVLSEASYKRGNNAKQKLIDEEGLIGYDLLPETSREALVVETPDDKIIIAYRGTDFSNQQAGKWGDLGTDGFLAMGLGTLTPRYRRADKKYKQVKEKYPGKKIIFTGHSLGSFLAVELSKKHEKDEIETHVFNMGSSHITARKGFMDRIFAHKRVKKQKQRIKHYYIPGDVISVFGSAGDPSITHVAIKKNPEVRGSGVLHRHNIQHFKKR